MNIDPVQRRFGRAPSHVLQEGKKAVTPLIAHTDSAAAIVLVLRIARVVATSLCMRPRLVLSTDPAISILAVAFTVMLATKATAAFGVPADQRAVVDNGHLPAIAAAIPEALRTTSFGPTHNGKQFKTPTYQVGFIHLVHGPNNIIF
jgi:hypothetical protein